VKVGLLRIPRLDAAAVHAPVAGSDSSAAGSANCVPPATSRRPSGSSTAPAEVWVAAVLPRGVLVAATGSWISALGWLT